MILRSLYAMEFFIQKLEGMSVNVDDQADGRLDRAFLQRPILQKMCSLKP